ncbi:hypothetical protein H2198_006372 [Neophaeococcomyces mojaviensis]|uniref:Uncharacterized protein n=1 Tax=Neophaeococcomyces mojaviensis TaxID=3383035 RepID=A0ACC3A3C1_9EURO|nr:hypothetical protein H2198_006372 [Knufia sp. JES_112]
MSDASLKHDTILALLPGDPPDVSCKTALDVAARALPEPIFNHSLRVYLLAKWLAVKENSDWAREENLPLLFVACIAHDWGASDMYNGEQRFEVEGADAASSHLSSHGYPADECHKVWCAIALHTSPGIAERIDPFTRLVRMGVKMDFSPSIREANGAGSYAAEIEAFLPRLNIEKVLSDTVVKQAVKIPDKVDSMTWPDSQKHPKASWPGLLLRAHLENPGYDGVNPAF